MLLNKITNKHENFFLTVFGSVQVIQLLLLLLLLLLFLFNFFFFSFFFFKFIEVSNLLANRKRTDNSARAYKSNFADLQKKRFVDRTTYLSHAYWGKYYIIPIIIIITISYLSLSSSSFVPTFFLVFFSRESSWHNSWSTELWSLATSPYHSSPLAGLQGYILYPHIAAVCMFELVILLLLGHMWGSTGVHHLWVRLCFSSSVLRVRFV